MSAQTYFLNREDVLRCLTEVFNIFNRQRSLPARKTSVSAARLKTLQLWPCHWPKQPFWAEHDGHSTESPDASSNSQIYLLDVLPPILELKNKNLTVHSMFQFFLKRSYARSKILELCPL